MVHGDVTNALSENRANIEKQEEMKVKVRRVKIKRVLVVGYSWDSNAWLVCSWVQLHTG